MKQVLQNISNGETMLVDVPCPKAAVGQVLIKTHCSLVSIGTERMLIDFGKASWFDKARQQPDKVKMVMDKVKTDGVIPTIEAVRSKLDHPIPLGYCNVGSVISGDGGLFKVGERVVSNGHHAEVVRVPRNLVARIPDNVDDESASFTVLGAIALQGIRLVNPTLGECVVVTGLGLIGLMAVQMLLANGCRVLGIDFDTAKCELARKFGAETVDLSKGEDAVQAAHIFSRGNGVDAVLITASSKSNDIMHQAATMCRKRGRIVLVGVVGLELRRADFYEKELTFQVSCSYGPGRYDEQYEMGGNDYPLGFVRWTEQRNFQAVLDLMATGTLDVRPLITHRHSIEEAPVAYQALEDVRALGILLNYPEKPELDLINSSIKLALQNKVEQSSPGIGRVAFIGAGNYASRVLIPAFKKAGAILTTVVTSGGVSAIHHGNKNGFLEATTDVSKALSDSSDTIVIATRHNQHARQTVDALNAGKHVFVEKPLALTLDELESIELAYKKQNDNCHLMVGFNRRFSPHIQKMKTLIGSKSGPKTFIMTMNAGAIPADHWTQDPLIGGGRIIGEACHYVDLMRYLAGASINDFRAIKIGGSKNSNITEDKSIITLSFSDGSIGTIHYFANGGKSFPKERVEVFCDDSILQLDNFRRLIGYNWSGFHKFNLWRQNKGQVECANAFISSIKNGDKCPIPYKEIIEVSRVSIQIAESLRKY